MGAILGWVVLAGMAAGGYLLFRGSFAPGVQAQRTSRIAAEAGPHATDPVLNTHLPIAGQADTRTARQVINHWLIAVGCMPDGQPLNGPYDLDIGGWQNGQDTRETGEHGVVGSIWVPAYGRLIERIEAKMISEVSSGFPANPPNENDMSERSRRMDFRQCAWLKMKRVLGQSQDFGFGAWREVIRHRGSRSRADALRAQIVRPR